MAKRDLPPVHPGELLYEDFMKPLGITQYMLAKEIHVGGIRISEIIHGKRSITADTALRLAKFFNMSAQFWMNAQAHYDLEIAEQALADKINKEVRAFKKAA